MGTEIAEAPMASLTLAANSGALNTTDERTLTDEQFALVERIAAGPPPALPMCDDEDVRKIIGALAGTLKQARTSLEEGKLKLGMYRKAISGRITKAALAYAGDCALRELEWMPTPSELLKLAEHYLAPEKAAHARARFLARSRHQRLFDERCKALRERTFPMDQLHTLSDQEILHGITNRAILKELDGTLIPWTREDAERIHSERRLEIGWEPPSSDDERSFHAREPSSGAVGDAVAGVMDGIEVSEEPD